ncbi:MAG: hypothetical protein SCG72_02895 [Nitrosarchaeum sp.]|nr:hypothetical protein [Nitrosarchaeum sp.]
MSPFEVYSNFLAFKNHFTKKNYDYFKYCGKTRASLDSFHKRKDRYFFEKISRQKNDEEIKSFFVANFAECNDPERLWIGDIIRNGEDTYSNWLKKSQSLTYLFKTECEVFVSKENFENLFDCKNGNHPEILKKYLQKALTLETLVILNMILNYVKDFDKKMNDPVWEMVSLKIQKYQSFLNINVAGYKKILKEIVYE